MLATFPAAVTLPSASASAICSDTTTGTPSTEPSWPVSSVALGPSLSTVWNSVMLWTAMNVLTSVTNASSDGRRPYLPSLRLSSLNISAETAALWSLRIAVLSTNGRWTRPSNPTR